MATRDLSPTQPGERTNGEGKPVGNKLLLLLPDEEYRLIRPHLEFTNLPHHTVLHDPKEKLDSVWFLNDGLISLVVETENGRTVEAGLVGNEGVSGIPSTVGLTTSPLREIVQISGTGFRMRVADLQDVLKSATEFQMILSRYAVLQGMQVAQTAACNRLHELDQRLARWLLMAQDRVDSGFLPITQDFLATMLGTDRPSVSLAEGALRRKRIIECTRGAVRIVNRKKLEGFACECYSITQQYNGELGLR